MPRKNIKTLACILTPLLLSASCTSSRYAMREDRAPQGEIDVSNISDAVPRAEPRSKYGNPVSYVVSGRKYHVMQTAEGFRQRGIASWYGSKFHGHRTSSGEPYNMYHMTAAHKTLPLPSYVRVTNLENHQSIVVRVNDRGPFHENRIIDLSYAAAKKLEITGQGTGMVEITYIDPRQKPARARVAAIGNKSANKHTSDKETAAKEKVPLRMYLQVGAFADRSNAEQLRERVAGILANGEINTGYNIENKLYRVRIGPLASVDEADKLVEKLTKSGIDEPSIVID